MLYLVHKTLNITCDCFFFFFFFDNLIRFEIFKATWDVPVKNNNDENNNDATLLAKFFCLSLYGKME